MKREKKPPTNVRVAVRVRPLLPKELLEKSISCLSIIRNHNHSNLHQVIVGNKRSFTYDYVFDEHSSQVDVYENCVKPMMGNVFQGYNGTIFCYGQTTSGKTYTMGSSSENYNKENLGIISRVINEIFERVKKEKENGDGNGNYVIKCTNVEIYNEMLRDLLNPETPSKSIHIREDKNNRIFIVGIKEETCENYKDAIRYLHLGCMHRTTGETLLNIHSSRSHSIFTLYIEKQLKNSNGDVEGVCFSSQLNLVDLAGSERTKKTGAIGQRLKEACAINSGLLALGNVISALGDEKKRKVITHVNYRDSKLTRLLQDSLGGNSHTLMICCVSPADICFEETLNSLKYANRARNIRNKPVINKNPHTVKIEELRGEIENLRDQLTQYKNNDGKREENMNNPLLISTRFNDKLNELLVIKENNISLQEENSEMKIKLKNLNQNLVDISENLIIIESERDKCIQRLKEIGAKIEFVIRSLNSIGKDEGESMIGEIIEEMKSVLSYIQFSQINSPRKMNQSRADGFASVSKSLFVVPLKGQMNVETSNSPNLIIQQQVVLIKELEEDLTEAKEDLLRDEKIFHEKVREIQKLSVENEMLRNLVDKELINDKTEKKDDRTNIEENVVIVDDDDQELFIKSISPRNLEMENKEKELEFQLKKLEDEKRFILEERKKIEKEKKEVERLAMEQKMNFEEEMQSMEGDLKQYTHMINMKEDLVKTLLKSEQESQLLKEQYKERILKLEEGINSQQGELDQLLKDIELKQMESENKEKEKMRIKKLYENKLKKRQSELKNLREKEKQNENELKKRYSNEKRLKEMQSEVSKLKSRQKFLQKKIKNTRIKSKESEKFYEKEIKKLKKQDGKKKRKIKILEEKNKNQQSLIRKKTSIILKTKKEMKKRNRNANRYKAFMDKQKEKLEKQIESFIKQKDAMGKLQKELKLKERIMKKREINRKKRLKLKKGRENKHLKYTRSINGLTQKIQNFQQQINEKIKTQQSVGVLESKKNSLFLEKKRLEDKIKNGSIDEYDEIKKLDELTDIMDAEIEFKSNEIKKVQKLIDNGKTVISFDDLTEIADAKDLLKKYFNKIIELKEIEREKCDKIQEYEVYLNDKERVCRNLQNNIRLTEMKYERKMLKLQKENEMKIQYLLKRIDHTESTFLKSLSLDGSGFLRSSMSMETPTSPKRKDVEKTVLKEKNMELEKNIFYYKKTNEDLRNEIQRLRQQRTQSLINSQEYLSLLDDKRKLNEQLKNLKSFIKQRSQVDIVTVSQNRIKEVSVEEYNRLTPKK